MAGHIEVGLLGSVAVLCDEAPVPVAGVKLRAIVAMLALGAPHPVSDDRLIVELWGDDSPVNPANALQAQISNLRRMLGRDAVRRSGPGYVLAVGPEDVDAIRLERLVRAGREAMTADDVARAADHYTGAVDLVRGQPLDDLVEYTFARDAASRLDELIQSAHEGVIDARLALGDHDDVISTLTGLVRTYPLRERFHAQLLLALYRSGRQADALRAFQHARRLLLEELGVDPGPELCDLERAVLAQDRSLDAPERRVAARPATSDPTSAPAVSIAGPGRLPLTGRERELDELLGDLAAVVAGHGRVALVGGEPGIGKTRLVEEAATRAVARDMTVVWGKCFEGRGAPAYWPWTQVVNGFLTRADEAEVRAAIGPDAAEISLIAPEIKEIVGPFEAAPHVDPESARFRLNRAMSAFIRRMARNRPVLVLLDDLHWADPASIAMVSFIAAEIDDSPVLVLGTYRNLDPAIGGALADTLVELSRQSTYRRLELRGLSREGLHQLLTQSGAVPDDHLLDIVHRRTLGNPFFVTELVRLLAAQGMPADISTMSNAVPESVRGLIRQRVARLPEVTAQTLAVAAALGQDFDLAILAATIDVDGATLLDHLEPAIDAGIVIDNPGGTSRYRFSHGLANETIYGDLGAAQKARTHLRIAETLEHHHGDTAGAHLIPIAAHWYHAVPAAPADTAIDAALRAAEWAQAHVAHQQAKEQLQAALELIATMPEGRHRSLRELEVQDRLSLNLIAATSYTDAEFGRVCDRIRELSEEIGDHALLTPALYRLTLHHIMKVDLAAGTALATQLIDPLRLGASPAARLTGNFGLGWLIHETGDQRRAREHLDRAVEMCDAGHDAELARSATEEPAVVSRVISSVNIALLGEEERAEEVAVTAMEIAARSGMHTWSTMVSYWSASTVAVLRRDAATTLARCDVGISLAIAGGYGLGIPYMGANRGWAIAALGDPDAGALLILDNAAMADAFGAVYMRHVFLAFHADACIMAGRVDDAHESIDRGFAAVAESGEHWYEAELHSLRGDALATRGNLDGAGGQYRQAIEIAERQGALGQARRAATALDRL